MPHRAVLFDLDGTLANALDDLADSMNWTLGQFHLGEDRGARCIRVPTTLPRSRLPQSGLAV